MFPIYIIVHDDIFMTNNAFNTKNKDEIESLISGHNILRGKSYSGPVSELDWFIKVLYMFDYNPFVKYI